MSETATPRTRFQLGLLDARARAIYDLLEGPVNNQDATRQHRQWMLALDIANALERADRNAGAVTIPVEPPPGLLMSIAIRLDHALGVPGYYDGLNLGYSHADKIKLGLADARRAYEEITGQGFYHPDNESLYLRVRGETTDD